MAERAGHVVVAEAADAESGFSLAFERTPDAIVVDGRLPPEGAPPFVARLRAAGWPAAIVVIAAIDETALVRDATAAGASGVLVRPFLPSRVAKALDARGCIADR
jgi:DNA-binding NarL/FixJ family response regulator